MEECSVGEHGKGGSAKVMYATVRWYEGVTDPNEAGREVEEGFMPIISEVPGFVAYYWVDAGDGVMISMSVYEDQSGSEESTRRAADYVQEHMGLLTPERASGHSRRGSRAQD
jgi:hypothetical protein